jgi:hypothetical protein
MRPDPEPHDGVAFQFPQGSLADSHSGGVHRGFVVDFLEVKTRMAWILLEQTEGSAGCGTYLLWQISIHLSKAAGGVGRH